MFTEREEMEIRGDTSTRPIMPSNTHTHLSREEKEYLAILNLRAFFSSLNKISFMMHFYDFIIQSTFFQGERLSHAVGCAFAICLEKKQQRDKLCTVSMTFDAGSAAFTRHGSFRQATLTERLQDPQVNKSFCMQ